jgi:hypothetical protein
MTALRDIKVPYILTCIVTGLQKAYTSKEFVQRKIDNYGGDEQKMIDGYVCKDAKREIKALGDVTKISESDVEKVIKKLGGTADAGKALKAIQGGALFLTKKVKVRAQKQGAGAKKKAAAKGKKAASGAKKARPSRSKAAIAARKAAKEAQSGSDGKHEGAAAKTEHAPKAEQGHKQTKAEAKAEAAMASAAKE